ncbi:DUF2163 domain-containing protein [Salinarimonas sp. NSM]|uniref:DUF2163 domain-containing protein n=1 Tax=Salinarimonas sp. NSM TaxID=3458003 RepID=UPI004036A36B
MRTIPPSLAARMGGGATTLARCWRVTRTDGVVAGFTDHDRDLAVEGTTFRAASGLEAAEAASELGFAVGGGEVAGALVSAGLTEADLLAGVWDDARVEVFLVDWRAPEHRMRLGVGAIGEVRRADGAFVAELRSLMHRLDEERGRLFRASCSADLGDARCRATAAPVAAVVGASDGALSVTAAALAGYVPEHFAHGRLVFTAGANQGFAVEVRAHRPGGVLDLWRRAPRPIAPGDAFTVTPGCDKSFETCAAKFANTHNFRGFPHMPGNDFVLRMPRQGEPGLDGGSLFR